MGIALSRALKQRLKGTRKWTSVWNVVVYWYLTYYIWQLSIVTGSTPFFTNLVDSDDTTAEVIGAASSEGVEDDVHLSYRNVTDIKKVGCAYCGFL